MNTTFRYYTALLFVLFYFNTTAKNVPIARSGLVGNAIAQFVPTGFNSAKTPSLILQKEPSIQKLLPAGWSIIPEFTVNKGKASAVIQLKGDISLYGGGEVTGPLLRNGQSIKLWNTDNGAYGTDNGKRLYQTHPWVLGVRKDGTAFGVLFDSSWKAELATKSDKIAYDSEGALFRVFVIDRKSPEEVLKGLAELTGTIEMPPRWALGYHQCRFSYETDDKVRNIANTFREKSIPCDAIWMDIDYMEGYRVFTFNQKNFSEPKKLNDYLHNKGFKSVFMIDPGVKVDENYSVYKSGTASDVWVKQPDGKEYHGKVWPGDCAFPDFTMPRTREWWSRLYKDFLSTGIDGIWNDMNEPAVNDNELAKDLRLGTMPYNTPHRGGGKLPAGPHLLYHNAYGRLMVEASRDGILAANPNKRPFVLTRANLLGGQRFAATWTGDNLASPDFMKVSVPMSLTLGLSGQPFSGPDIGGFLENTSGDLWAQWLGFGAFLPFARGHACAGTNNKEPWAFGPEVEKTSKIALERRYRLLPYLYTLFHNAHKTGLPVMLPAFFADLKDTRLRAEDQAFLLGSSLLVVPSFAKNPELPSGLWERLPLVDGDQSDPYQAKLLIKGGSIIPAGKIIQHTDEESLSTLTLFVCLDKKGNANGELYWDAGEGWGFKKGNFKHLNFNAKKEKGLVKVNIVKSTGNYNISNEITSIKTIVVQNGKQYVGTGSLKNGTTVHIN
jgi:alpha-glucosidase